jgi:hypothetical protein
MVMYTHCWFIVIICPCIESPSGRYRIKSIPFGKYRRYSITFGYYNNSFWKLWVTQSVTFGLFFSHICSNNKGTLQIFHDFKENCRITMEFNQFLSVNIGVIRLLSVITTTPFGNYGTSETMFDQKRWKKTKNKLVFYRSSVCNF